MNKKTKLIDDFIEVDSIDIPHYNKNQLVRFKCKVCNKYSIIKYSSFAKKVDLLCRRCQSINNSDYSERGKKISEAKQRNPISHEKAVAAQLNRSEEAKKLTIKKFRDTMSVKDKSGMISKMKAAKASMTEEEKIQRIEKFRESYYRSQKDRIIQRAKALLDNRNIKYSIKDFEFDCECPICSEHWTWTPIKKSDNYTQVPYCLNCFNKNVSSYELQIHKILDDLRVEYIANDRSILKGKELDIYIPLAKLAIEFDGVYWHNNSTKTLEKSKQLEGIQLINIFENEYDDHKIRSILSAKLHKSEIIYARKCVIEEIPNKVYKEFCERNHIQGYAAAKVMLGLFYKGQLIQIMSFGKPRFNRNYEWEIIRECSDSYGVVGGKQRLWKYFLKTYSPKSVISYCDKRYFTGESYIKLGMTPKKDTGPSYIYTNGKQTLSRYQCQKHKLENILDKFDKNLTEYENMSMNGYYRLYDFGQKVFVWEAE